MTVEWLDQHHLRVHLNGEPAEALNSMLVGQGLRVRELARERPTLEDVFLGLTGDGAVRAERGAAAVAVAVPRRPTERRGSPVAHGLGRGGRLVIGVELTKLLRRPRTWVTITLLVGLPVVVGIFLKATGIAPRPGSGPALLSEVLNNGVLFPAAALALILPVFLPVAVAVIAGDAIAGEASAGTLRYLLARPVSRSRLVTAKVIMALVFIVLAIAIVAVVGLIAGCRAVRHQAPDLAVAGPALTHGAGHPAHGPRRALHRLVDAGPGRDRPVRLDPDRLAAGRGAGALAAFVTSQVLDLIDATRAIKPYLPTHYWLSFVDLFRDPILWRGIERGCRAPSRLPRRVPRRGLGQLHDARTSPAESIPGASGLAGAPQRGLTHCRAKRVGASRSEAAAGDERATP